MASSSDHRDLDRVPVFSREMTLEAHFTFTAPSGPTPRKDLATTTSTTDPAPGGGDQEAVATTSYQRPPPPGTGMTDGAKEEDTWKWRKNRAQCYVSCGQHGVTMSYDIAPKAEEKVGKPEDRGRGAGRGTAGNYYSGSREARLESPGGGEGRGSNLPGGHRNGRGPRHPVRSYERRCKSTAHIVLQKVDGGGGGGGGGGGESSRAREFHGATTFEPLNRGGRDEAFHPPPPSPPVYHQYDWKGSGPLAPPPPAPLCPCPHCTTLHSLVSSLRYELPPCVCPCPHHYLPLRYQQPGSPRGLDPLSTPPLPPPPPQATPSTTRHYDTLPSRRARRVVSPRRVSSPPPGKRERPGGVHRGPMSPNLSSSTPQETPFFRRDPFVGGETPRQVIAAPSLLFG